MVQIIQKIYAFFFLFFLSIALFGQDTTYQFPTLTIEANRLQNFSIGHSSTKIDSSQLAILGAANLSDALSLLSNGFIKSYGLGSLSTSSFRGAGAGHTAVLWNGFNLQSSMNGVLDFALIPSFFLDNAIIEYGSSTALFGSGAVGASIHLNNQTEYNNGWQLGIQTTIGSFDKYQQGVKIAYSNARFFNRTRILYHTAANDFPFINTSQFGQPEVQQTNAFLEQKGILQENSLRLNDKQQLSFRFWYQDTYREIPPSMTVGNSVAFQEDQFYRTSLNWQRIGQKTAVYVRTAYFDENLVFNDAAISLNAVSHSKSWINEAETKIYLTPNQELNFGGNYSNFKAVSDGYPNEPTQNRLAFFGAYKWKNSSEKWQSVFSVRNEWTDFAKAVPTFSWAITRNLSKNWIINASASRHYRLPTFNDLYWIPGGNPNLIAENGWNQELGVSWKKEFGKNTWSANLTGFNNQIKDWILWRPINGIWSAENVLQVWSRGFEASVNQTYPYKKWDFNTNLSYQLTRSTNQKVADNALSSLHQQLIYTPIHTGKIRLSATYHTFYFYYHHTFTGKVFTTSNNTGFLKSYHLGFVNIGKGFEWKSIKGQLNFNINNIWNTTYQVIQARAMPLRHFELGINLVINNS